MAHMRCTLHREGYRHARTRIHTPKRPVNPPPPHTHTNAQTCNTYCFSTAIMIRERASMLRYTYIASLVKNYLGYFAPRVSKIRTNRV
jgi:hypothetical protein